MQDDKLFRTEVSSSNEDGGIPAVAEFSIDVSTAREIVSLAALVKAHGLYKVEKFDYRVRYLSHDVEEAADQADAGPDENEVRTEADTLNVSDDCFWFAAYLKHSDIEIRSEERRIDELIAHFNLVPGAQGTGPDATTASQS